MALEFFDSATGDPINLKRQVAQQTAVRVPATTGFVDFRSDAGPIAPAPSEVERKVVSLGGAPLANLPGKTNIEGGPFEIGDMDVANKGMLHFLANGMKKYTITDNTTWYQWRFGLDETTQASKYLTVLSDNDVLPRTRFKDLQIGGFDISAGPSENLSIGFPFVAGGYDFHDDPTQEAGTGSDLPILEHTWEGNWSPAATDMDIYIQVVTGVSFTFKVKIGSASTYDGATLTGVEGDWVRLTEENDERIGEYGEQIRLYVPTGATWTDADEFKFVRQRAAWTPSLGVERPLAAVNTAFIVDDVEYRVEGGWTISAAWDTLELKPDTSGKQGGTPSRKGELKVTLTPTREIVNLDFQKALHEGTTLSIVIDAVSDDKIGATAIEYMARMVFPAVRPTGTMFDAEEGAENTEETITLMAGVPDATFNYDGEAYDSHFTMLLQTDVASL